MLTNVTYPHQIAAYYTYDSRNRLTSVENKSILKGNIISSFSYEYDFMYNKVSQQEKNFGHLTPGTTTYQYDPNYRLTMVKYPTYQEQFTYDSVGNRKSMSPSNDSPTSYEYDDADRLTSSRIGTSRTNYYYDKNGNMIRQEGSDGYNRYKYNGADRLEWVKDETEVEVLMTFKYDGFGRRIECRNRRLNDFTKYLYDGLNVLLELDADGKYPKAEYIYANGQIICKYKIISNGSISETYYYHYDGLGSVVNITIPNAGDGPPAVSYSYDAFGKIKKQVGSLDINNFTFTGKPKGLQTGFYNFGARYYDEKTGRFLTKDPYLGDELNPKLRHRYVYCANNPVNYVDPYGYWVESLWDIASLGIGLAEFTAAPTPLGATAVLVDVGATLIPGVPGGAGVALKAAKVGERVVEKGWKLGAPVNKLTKAGEYPHWSTVRTRYWKNEALKHPEKYSPENLAGMRKGLAPQELNKVSGRLESKELHHLKGRDIPDPHNPDNLEPLWSDEHIRIHLYR